MGALLALSLAAAAPPRADAEIAAVSDGKRALTFIAPLTAAPFPVAEDAARWSGGPFFAERDPVTGEPVRIVNRQRYPRGRHYNDNRALFAAPPGFDPAKPFRIVLFFHGHFSEIEGALVRGLDLPGQVARSGANVVLIAPQLARDAADSSPGRLAEPGLAAVMLDEATALLRERLGGSETAWRRAPVVIAAFSGGYRATATVLERGAIDVRIEGIVLLDAIYGAVDDFAGWLRRAGHRSFLWAIYSDASRESTERLIERLLESRTPFARGDVAAAPTGIRFLHVPTAHTAVPVEGPPREPLATVLRRLGAPPEFVPPAPTIR